MSVVPTNLDATRKEHVLIIDDDPTVVSALTAVIKSSGFLVTTVRNATSALDLVATTSFDVILCDLQMPEINGLELLKKLREFDYQSPVIVMSAYGTIPIALEAIKLGADDYIAKPFNGDEILLAIEKVLERNRLRKENALLRQEVSRQFSFRNIVAKSEIMRDIFETIKKIADYKTTVTIYGESGTGKELVARAIHYNSSRRNRRFIAVNCGAIPENLLESELFGHKRGSFTDATRDRKGLFEEAQGGTILLDEVGELALHLQVKLLRVLQESEIRRVGDEHIIPIDVRVIAATLRDLEQDVLEGRFRDDLYYRLNVISLHVPPLRERLEDIPILIEHFVNKHKEKLRLPVSGVTKEALSVLIRHEWRGNIRELENCIERAMILTEGDKITVESLPKSVLETSTITPPSINIDSDELSIKVHSRIMEEDLIRKALIKTKGNRTHAAKLLEISHRTLLYKLKSYNLTDLEELQ